MVVSACPPRRRRVRQRSEINKLHFVSQNIGTLTGKSIELVKALHRRKISIACIQETKWVGTKVKEIDRYKLWCSALNHAKNGASILVMRDLVEVVEVRCKIDRIMSIKLVVGSEILPQRGLDEDSKRLFWDDLDGFIQSILQNEKLLIGGDFNGHIGRKGNGCETIYGGFGYGRETVEECQSWTLRLLTSYRSLTPISRKGRKFDNIQE